MRSLMVILDCIEGPSYSEEDMKEAKSTLTFLLNRGILHLDVYKKYMTYLERKEAASKGGDKYLTPSKEASEDN